MIAEESIVLSGGTSSVRFDDGLSFSSILWCIFLLIMIAAVIVTFWAVYTGWKNREDARQALFTKSVLRVYGFTVGVVGLVSFLNGMAVVFENYYTLDSFSTFWFKGLLRDIASLVSFLIIPVTTASVMLILAETMPWGLRKNRRGIGVVAKYSVALKKSTNNRDRQT